MLISDLVREMERIAPTAAAEEWDNVGLLVGEPSQTLSRLLLTIDYTALVAREAIDERCDGVIAYHPPIFKPLKRLDPTTPVGEALRRGIAIYSPHTALDVAEGGTNDVLCDALELKDRQPLKAGRAVESSLKLVTFVPIEAVDRVAEAMFAAGAGRIGQYSHCSFRSPGTGTFFGEQGAHPAVGETGRLERVDEIRLEVVLPARLQARVTAALRATHPYEEPAFDLVMLAAAPTGGIGRIGQLTSPASRQQVIDRLKSALQLEHLMIAGLAEGPASRVAVCAGSCGDLLDAALRGGADVYVTGEMRHHDALRAAAAGLTVLCTLHSNSERLALSRLKQRLAERLPGLEILLSRADRDPFSVR